MANTALNIYKKNKTKKCEFLVNEVLESTITKKPPKTYEEWLVRGENLSL